MADVMRQTYRVLSDAEKEDVRAIKEKAAIFYDHVGILAASRETSLAKTKIEEAVMWAVKAITG